MRESSVLFISNHGFSVVVPTSMSPPASTEGSRTFCCFLLKWYISSTKAIAERPVAAFDAAASSSRSRSVSTFALTAFISSNSRPVTFAMRRTSVVLPTPGGP